MIATEHTWTCPLCHALDACPGTELEPLGPCEECRGRLCDCGHWSTEWLVTTETWGELPWWDCAECAPRTLGTDLLCPAIARASRMALAASLNDAPFFVAVNYRLPSAAEIARAV